MRKAETYLYDRLDMLSQEKVILITKINGIDLEVEEIEYKIKDLKKNIDDAFEVFSPRTRKNDFVKSEIEKLEAKLKDLTILRGEYDEQVELVTKDINVIKAALGEYGKTDESYDYEEENRTGDVSFNFANIIKGQEWERKRIAAELHDSTVQVLTNLVHKCEICSKVMDVDTVRSKLELEVMSKTLKDTINNLRGIIYNLRPMSFDDIGLDITLDRIVSQENKDSDINIVFNIEGEKKKIDETESITLVRVLQEALNNSKKHAKCKNIKVTLSYFDDEVEMKIADDGSGFDMNGIKYDDDTLSGFGLSIMMERVYLLNGNIDIKSEPEKGTEITVTLPNTNETEE